MPAKLRKVLCVEPSVPQQAALAAHLASLDLALDVCRGEAEAMRMLAGDYALMVVADELTEGDSFRLIESVRLSPDNATMPIAFLADIADSNLAYNALRVGATEVFLRDDLDTLADFIVGCTAEPENIELGGVVLLLEDSELHAAYVIQICEMLGMQVEHYTTVQAAMASYRPRKYQLVIADIVLDDFQSGIALVRFIRRNHRDRQPILVMSGYDDVPRRLLALKSGTDDFIAKPFSPEEFVWRVMKTFKAYAGYELAGIAATVTEAGLASDTAGFMHALSPREREIAKRILSGMTDKEIAYELGISFWTVRSHIEQVFTKTGALNRRDLMARFIGK